jgi:hypothetical protein
MLRARRMLAKAAVVFYSGHGESLEAMVEGLWKLAVVA